MESKYSEAISGYKVETDENVIKADIASILDKHLEENRTPEVLKFLFSSIDLTTLRSTDSMQSVSDFTEKVNEFETNTASSRRWLRYACTLALPKW